MLNKSLALKFFDAASIQRWNDKLRPIALTELDKHAHKAIIVYCLGKYEEERGVTVKWDQLINGIIFELLRRTVLSDIKSPIYWKIKQNHKPQFIELNNWVYKNLEDDLAVIAGESMKTEFKQYLIREDYLDPLSENILNAAHIYSSYWEFQIIKQTNPNGYKVHEIDKLLLNDIEQFLDLAGMRKLITQQKIADFINLCGQLRYQIRWGNIPRMPQTSVLGHMLLVACFTYMLSLEINSCPKRLYNNFFGGLFHDLPESVTRDIISPVKNSVKGLPEAISQIERELAAEEIYPLIEPSWIPEFKYFTEREFESKVVRNDKIETISSDEITKSFNLDTYSPIDGELVEVTDKFAAFLEAYAANDLGIMNKSLQAGLEVFPKMFEGRIISDLQIYDMLRS